MRLGFTGTQMGMTKAQKAVLHRWLSKYRGGEFRHGDCIGADAEAHDIAEECGLCTIVHPPEDSTKRAYKLAKFMAVPKPYLDRNRDIVKESEVLIAAPKEADEVLRSGTWSTIRFAKKRGIPVNIIFPSGRSEKWRPDVVLARRHHESSAGGR